MHGKHKPTKARCPGCDGEMPVNVLGEQHYGYEEADIIKFTYALQCKGCKKIFLYETSFGPDVYIDADFDEYRTDDEGREEKIIITPTPQAQRKHQKGHQGMADMLLRNDSGIAFDKAIFIESLYNEISDAINTKKCILACLGMRTLLKLLYGKQTKNPDTQNECTAILNGLAQKSSLSKQQKAIVQTVLATGNAVARSDAVPTMKDIVDCMQIIEHVIEAEYPLR